MFSEDTQKDAHEALGAEPKYTPSKEVHQQLTEHGNSSGRQARKNNQARYQMVWDMYTKVGVEGFALLEDSLIQDVWHAYNQAGYNNYPVPVALKAELLRRGVSVYGDSLNEAYRTFTSKHTAAEDT